MGKTQCPAIEMNANRNRGRIVLYCRTQFSTAVEAFVSCLTHISSYAAQGMLYECDK